jgi:putative permease
MNIVKQWFHDHFSDPQVVILALVLVFGIGVVLTIGDMIAPVIASVVIAFLLDGVIKPLQRVHVPRFVAVGVVFSLFMIFLGVVLFGLLPLLTTQLAQFIKELPGFIAQGQTALLQLPEKYPAFISEAEVRNLMASIGAQLTVYGQKLVTFSLSSLGSLFSFIIYLVLMPIMVFFFLKDKNMILAWGRAFLPEDHSLASRVWQDVNRQIGNYVRGKVWEIMIIWGTTYVTLLLIGMDYAMLLGFLVGLSVIIPYIGATVVTIPVAVLAYFQWGWGTDFGVAVLCYTVIQILDGNLLVPILLSEVVDLHPIAIITAILVFGGFWGLWGVFFAIPLATVVQAVLNAWPNRVKEDKG